MSLLTNEQLFAHGVELLRTPSTKSRKVYDTTLPYYMMVIYTHFAEDPTRLTEEMKEVMLDIAVIHFSILLDGECKRSYEFLSEEERQASRERIRCKTYHGCDASDANVDECAYDLWELAEVYMKKILQMFTC